MIYIKNFSGLPQNKMELLFNRTKHVFYDCHTWSWVDLVDDLHRSVNMRILTNQISETDVSLCLYNYVFWYSLYHPYIYTIWYSFVRSPRCLHCNASANGRLIY